MESEYKNLVVYLQQNPITFKELENALNTKPYVDSFFILVGTLKPRVLIEIEEGEDADKVELTRVATLILYNLEEKTLNQFYELRTVYNDIEETESTVYGVDSTGTIELNEVLNFIKHDLENAIWIPDATILGKIFTNRTGKNQRFSKKILTRLNYPNSSAPVLMKKYLK